MGLIPDDTKCPRPDKTSYVSRRLAKEALKGMRAYGHTNGMKYRVYLCDCGLFHIGSKTANRDREWRQ